MAQQRRRGFETAGDMIRSLGLVLLGVAALLLLTLRDEPDDPVTVVDDAVVSSTVGQARSAAPYALEEPVGLSSDWRVTSIRYEPGTESGDVWHIGYVTPSDDYAALEQTDDDVLDVLEGQLPDAAPEGTVDLGDRTWERYVDDTVSRRALVTQSSATPGTAGATSEVAVAGSASWDELEELARSLTSAPAPQPTSSSAG